MNDPRPTMIPWHRDPWEWALRLGICGLCAAALWMALVRNPAALWAELSGQTAAAWVQAVGSIAAIAGAFLVASMQLRHAQMRDLEKERLDAVKHYVAIRAVARRAGEYCKVHAQAYANVQPGAEKFVFADAGMLEFSEFKSLVDGFSLVDMPNAGLIHRVSNLSSYLGRASRALESGRVQVEAGQVQDGKFWFLLKFETDNVMQAAHSVINLCDAGLRELDFVLPDEI